MGEFELIRRFFLRSAGPGAAGAVLVAPVRLAFAATGSDAGARGRFGDARDRRRLCLVAAAWAWTGAGRLLRHAGRRQALLCGYRPRRHRAQIARRQPLGPRGDGGATAWVHVGDRPACHRRGLAVGLLRRHVQPGGSSCVPADRRRHHTGSADNFNNRFRPGSCGPGVTSRRSATRGRGLGFRAAGRCLLRRRVQEGSARWRCRGQARGHRRHP
jgi:hypothetical protein